MPRLRSFYNKTRGALLAERVLIADNLFSRMRGLLWRPQIQPGEGLYLKPCTAIHMIGMKYAIDAVFLDQSLCVVGLLHAIAPGAVSPVFPRAAGCLELPAGTLARTGTEPGDQIACSDAPDESATKGFEG